MATAVGTAPSQRCRRDAPNCQSASPKLRRALVLRLHEKVFRCSDEASQYLLFLGNRISPDVFFGHDGRGTFIAGPTRIGKRCVIMHGVTLGITIGIDGRQGAAPVVGDDVFIGAGANIVGRCVIGDGARIGAGVTLTNVAIAPGTTIVNKSAYDMTNNRFVYPQD